MIWQIVQEDGISINLNPTPVHILYGHTESVTCVDLSVELDLVASGSLDGTINLYNLKSGHYIKTLNVKTIQSPELKVFNIKLSDQRHILAYSYRCLDEDNFVSKFQVLCEK
jgi:WD40 repeat protein